MSQAVLLAQGAPADSPSGHPQRREWPLPMLGQAATVPHSSCLSQPRFFTHPGVVAKGALGVSAGGAGASMVTFLGAEGFGGLGPVGGAVPNHHTDPGVVAA